MRKFHLSAPLFSGRLPGQGGIIIAIVTGATTARSEGFNAVNQKIKSDARGHPNRDGFRAAIYLHLGGLDLYPDSLHAFRPT